jgi:osmotically-inducible protein OsmY
MDFKPAGDHAAIDMPFIPSESATFSHQAAQEFGLYNTRGYSDEELEAATDDAGRYGEDEEGASAEPAMPRTRTAMADRIWTRLNQRPDLELGDIQLHVERDSVRVTGLVATDAARRRIVDFVSACAGVRVVRNGIRLAP